MSGVRTPGELLASSGVIKSGDGVVLVGGSLRSSVLGREQRKTSMQVR